MIKCQSIAHFRGLKVGHLFGGWALIRRSHLRKSNVSMEGAYLRGHWIHALQYRSMQFSEEMRTFWFSIQIDFDQCRWTFYEYNVDLSVHYLKVKVYGFQILSGQRHGLSVCFWLF